MEKPLFHFKEPKAKKKFSCVEFSPLPVFNEFNRDVYVGRLAGDCVHVDQTSNICLLYSMGFFGKGNLSWSNPQYSSGGQQELSQTVMSRRRYLMHCKWASTSLEKDDEDVLPYKRKKKTDNLMRGGMVNCASAATVQPELDASFPNPVAVRSTSYSFTEDVTRDSSAPDPWLMCSEKESEAFWGKCDDGDDVTGTCFKVEDRPPEQTLSSHQSGDVKCVMLPTDIEKLSISLKCDSTDLESQEDFCDARKSDDLRPVDEQLLDIGTDPALSQEVPNTDQESGDLSSEFPSDCDLCCVVDDTEDSEIDPEERPTWKTVLKRDPYPLSEHLILSLEEAFFLSYTIGCLVVNDSNDIPMNLTDMWCAFCKQNTHFPFRYAAYHYYRSKSWVPKSGIKYGVDFLLYKWGPSFYHGTYSVKVKALQEHCLKSNSSANHLAPSWTSLSGLNRITEQVSKELLMCYVIVPDALLDADLASPTCLADFRITEVIVRRWISKKERESSEFFLIP